MDLIVVIIDGKSDGECSTYYDPQIGNMDISLYDEDKFINQIKGNEVKPLEAIFVRPQYIIFGDPQIYLKDFVCFHPSIRHTFGKVARLAWNKGFKKLIKETDPKEIRAGKKSLYHSIRVFCFALHLFESGKINFDDLYLAELNNLYFELMQKNVDEIIIDNKMKKEYQDLYDRWDNKFRQIPNEEQYKQLMKTKK